MNTSGRDETDPPKAKGGPEKIANEANPAIWLLGSLAVATAALTFFGLNGDALARIVRVHEWALFIGAALLLFALSAGFATLSEYPATPGRRFTQFAGLIAFVFGVGVLLWAHADATSEQQRPSVAAALSSDEKTGLSAKVTVKAAGLKPDQYVYVVVQGANDDTLLDDRVVGELEADKGDIPDGEFATQRLYKGRVGPDPKGEVSAELAVPVSSHLYDQVWVKARIIESGQRLLDPATVDPDQAVGDEVDEEYELEFGSLKGPVAFPCSKNTTDTACGVALVPEMSAPKRP